MLVQCTVDSKHHVLSANSSSVQVWQRNYWGSIEVLWRGGPSSYVVVGIIFVHIIHHAHIDIVGGDNDDDGVGADADLEIVVVHVWGAVRG